MDLRIPRRGPSFSASQGIEGDDDIAWRKNLLRQIGYKL